MSIHLSHNSRFSRTASIGLLAGCLCFSAGAVVLAQESSPGAQPQAQQATRSDAEIQSDVSRALAHDPTLQGQKINSPTADGIVTLNGTVETNAQFQQAETIASKVPGVAGILNNIKVADPNSPIPPPPPDTADTLAPGADTAQSNVPPPPPDMEPNAQAAPNTNAQAAPEQAPGNQAPPSQEPPNQAPPQPYFNARPPYQPQQGGYYPPPQPGRYYPAPQQGYNAPPPSGPVTIPAGTLLRVRLSETLDTAHLKPGTYFQGTAANDVYQNGVLAIPRGAVVQGQVIQARNAGELGGSAELQLQIDSINLGGAVFPLATDVWSNKGPNKAGYTAANTAGGAAFGAIIGGLIGGGAGAAIGAGVGGVGGLAASSATHGPRLILPVESTVDFHLTAPATVQPVSWQEAQRLASSVPPPPRLVRRPYPYYPYGPYPYGPYPY